MKTYVSTADWKGASHLMHKKSQKIQFLHVDVFVNNFQLLTLSSLENKLLFVSNIFKASPQHLNLPQAIVPFLLSMATLSILRTWTRIPADTYSQAFVYEEHAFLLKFERYSAAVVRRQHSQSCFLRPSETRPKVLANPIRADVYDFARIGVLMKILKAKEVLSELVTL